MPALLGMGSTEDMERIYLFLVGKTFRIRGDRGHATPIHRKILFMYLIRYVNNEPRNSLSDSGFRKMPLPGMAGRIAGSQGEGHCKNTNRSSVFGQLRKLPRSQRWFVGTEDRFWTGLQSVLRENGESCDFVIDWRR